MRPVSSGTGRGRPTRSPETSVGEPSSENNSDYRQDQIKRDKYQDRRSYSRHLKREYRAAKNDG
jgi:hypothetical protein